METRVSKECVRIAKEKLCIWADSESTIVLRFPAIKLEERRRIYPRIASVPTSAKKRLYDKIRDSYRGEFQRDRDRVLWSEAFKKLAGKTQMLPWEGASEIRNRLSHTIEVTELASTFARIFRLNEDLTQAIAFAPQIVACFSST